jgi:ComF family protein
MLCPYCLNDQLQPAVEDPNAFLPDGIERRISMWQFDKQGIIQHLLHGLKYSGMSALGEELGYTAAKAHGIEPMLIIPVPLHPHRLRKRGYNQAKSIALGVARASGGEVLADGVIIRTRHTRTQTGFSLDQRNENIRNAFECTDPSQICDREILLVDDVFTTGATLFELYKVCRQAGPARVTIFTLAQA